MLIAGAGGGLFLLILGLLIVMRRRKPGDDVGPIVDEGEPPPPGVVEALRGGEIVGGKYVYKVKVNNGTEYVINNVIVTITAYPEDCMVSLDDDMAKRIKRIEPGGFRSPSFEFEPTSDCVKGNILATVSYIDHHDQNQIMTVRSFEIKSVCDLLTPMESTIQEFDLILGDMEVTTEQHTLDWNPEILFQNATTFLPSCNFHIMDSKSSEEDGQFTGEIRGLAIGKHTQKRIAVRLTIVGPIDGNEAQVDAEVLGDDLDMLPVALGEITKGINSWICLNCGAAFEPEEVDALRRNESVTCDHCKHTLTIDLYRR
jgi:hypothetical protein